MKHTDNLEERLRKLEEQAASIRDDAVRRDVAQQEDFMKRYKLFERKVGRKRMLRLGAIVLSLAATAALTYTAFWQVARYRPIAAHYDNEIAVQDALLRECSSKNSVIAAEIARTDESLQREKEEQALKLQELREKTSASEQQSEGLRGSITAAETTRDALLQDSRAYEKKREEYDSRTNLLKTDIEISKKRLTSVETEGDREKVRIQANVDRLKREKIDIEQKISAAETPRRTEPVIAPKPTREGYGLVVAAGPNIYCVAPGRKVLVARRNYDVIYLKLSGENIFDGGYIVGSKASVYETLTGKSLPSDIVDDPWFHPNPVGPVKKILHNDNCYSAEEDDIFDCNDTKVTSRSNDVRCFGSHNGTLYDGGDYNEVYNTLQNKVVAERDGDVYALASCSGTLYDGGSYNAVFDTLGDPRGSSPLWTFDDDVLAMISVPLSMWNALVGRND